MRKNVIDFKELLEDLAMTGVGKYWLEKAQPKMQEELYFANTNLLYDTNYLEKLYCEKGLTRLTAETLKIGFDTDNHEWKLPIFQYETALKNRLISGFQYYSWDFKNEINKDKKIHVSLSMINEYSEGNTEYVFVAKDNFDCYTFFQYFGLCGDANRIHLVTSVHGVKCLPNLISCLNFNKYRNFLLFLGDENSAVEDEIICSYPMFEKIDLDRRCNSFNEYFLKYIKPGMPTPKY